MLYPKTVDVSSEQMAKLSALYESAYKRIASEIDDATDFGKYNRKMILSQVEKILKDLGIDVQQFLEDEIPGFYKQGADEAIKQLNRAGADVSVAYGFSRIHKEAITNLIDDIGTYFAGSMTGVKRNTVTLLNLAVKEEIMWKVAEGRISGEALKKIKAMVKGVFEEQGIFFLKDKANRTWTLDRYTEMLIRTKAVEARNRGLINRVLENDYDLVQVSDHTGECEMCRPWENKILSLTGKTKGYPTLDRAMAEGLFHPNCKHAINTLIPELAKQTKAYDIYSGKYS